MAYIGQVLQVQQGGFRATFIASTGIAEHFSRAMPMATTRRFWATTLIDRIGQVDRPAS